jgi:diaminohydroxyphosphoribosylaminopyrimidine deaminase / 5-amino-6-(5-phosphoribosylamino)uracil reductase
VEAGPILSGAFIRAGLVDEVLLYLAPKLLGPGRPLAELPALASIDAAPAFVCQDVTVIGVDFRLLLRPTATPLQSVETLDTRTTT